MPLSQIRSSRGDQIERISAQLKSRTRVPSRPLRVGVVTEYYYPHLGGVCEHVHFFAREARRRGHYVDVITSNIAGAAQDPNVIRIGRSQPVMANGSLARITVGVGIRRKMREVLRRGRYDVVHVHSPLNPTLPLLAIEEAECAVVGTFHTFVDGRSLAYAVSRWYFAHRIKRLDAAIAVSRSAVKAVEHYVEADWRVIPNGIDVVKFHPGAHRPPDVPTDVPVILYLGRLDPRNGLRDLIEAFRIVRRERPAHLLVVGDGPLRGYYRRIAGDDPAITFLGSVDDQAGYYANAAIYACPTTRGASFGITLLEAMACERPIVCSDIPGFRNVVRNGHEALMVPPENPEAIAQALLHLLDDETLRARMGKAGRQTALAYSWDRVTDAVLGVYADVLGEVARPRLPLSRSAASGALD